MAAFSAPSAKILTFSSGTTIDSVSITHGEQLPAAAVTRATNPACYVPPGTVRWRQTPLPRYHRKNALPIASARRGMAAALPRANGTHSGIGAGTQAGRRFLPGELPGIARLLSPPRRRQQPDQADHRGQNDARAGLGNRHHFVAGEPGGAGPHHADLTTPGSRTRPRRRGGAPPGARRQSHRAYRWRAAFHRSRGRAAIHSAGLQTGLYAGRSRYRRHSGQRHPHAVAHALLEIKDGKATLVATDGHRLSLHSFDAPGVTGEHKLLISRHVLETISK